MTPAEKRARKVIDDRIDEIVRRRLRGVPINVLDIGTVFKVGYAAVMAGADLEATIVEEYTRLSERCR
jgi:hypothetical protein